MLPLSRVIRVARPVYTNKPHLPVPVDLLVIRKREHGALCYRLSEMAKQKQTMQLALTTYSTVPVISGMRLSTWTRKGGQTSPLDAAVTT
jgi:hypothetical protein